MNERIKELAKQSYKEVIETNDYNGSAYTVREFDKEKFAELIVRECAITVIDRCEMRNAEDIKRAEYHAKRIKQHFGVEE